MAAVARTTTTTSSAEATRPSSSSSSSSSSPPPLRLVDVDPDERFPPPPPTTTPSTTDEDVIAADLVSRAISGRHERHPVVLSSSSSSHVDVDVDIDRASVANAIVEARISSDRLSDLLAGRGVRDANLLRYALESMPGCDSGMALDCLASHPKLHARTIHLIMILDPFVPDGIGGGGVGGVDGLRIIDAARRERGNGNRASASAGEVVVGGVGGGGVTVRIDESSIRHKEDSAHVIPNAPYFTYGVADAYLRLLIALASCNSAFGPPAVRSLWRLLTDFGGRWKDWAVRNEREEEEEEKRRRRRRRRRRDSAGTGEGEDGEGRERERPAEGERPVPGMGGLSVDFVRDAFSLCNGVIGGENNIHDEVEADGGGGGGEAGRGDGDLSIREEIYSDRLPSGRVRRLLLALTNVFRVCPQSKLDLLRELTTNFPHYKFCPRQRYVWYVHACMQMVHLAQASFEGPVLALFVDRALDMDVEIKINDGGAVALTAAADDGDDDDVAASSAAVTLSTPKDSRKRSLEEMASTSVAIPDGNNGASTSSNPPAAASSSADGGSDDEDADRVLEISDRLDALMTTIYQRIVLVTTYDPNSLTSAMAAVVRARRLYRTHLEGVFEKKVRTTDRTKFVQFIFLVLFGRENEALEEVGRLLSKREEEQRLQLLRRQSTDRRDVVPKTSTTTAVMEMEKMDPELITMPTSSDEPLYRGFIAKLIDYFYNPNYAGDAPRRTVVCYLASFVSRATYVCPETVCECLAALLRWAEVYISAQSEASTMGRRGGVRRLSSSASRSSLGGNTLHTCEMHALFYTCCQAVFYIFCFRGAEALMYYRRACRHKDDPESPYADPESVDIGPERWKFICGHPLQPLKYCLESVRVEYLNLAQDLNLFCGDDGDDGEAKKDEATKFLDRLRNNTLLTKEHAEQNTPHTPKKLKSTIQKPRRSTIISTAATQEKKRLDGGVGGLGRGSNPLDSFFPFDPYLLQNSYEHVHPYFRNWEDCILTIEHDAENDCPVEESLLSEDSNSEVDHEDDERIEDSNSDLSDLDDEEELVDVQEDDSDDEEEDEDESNQGTGKIGSVKEGLTAAARVNSLHDDDRFEMEIRRSRAMSTGSQCSW